MEGTRTLRVRTDVEEDSDVLRLGEQHLTEPPALLLASGLLVREEEVKLGVPDWGKLCRASKCASTQADDVLLLAQPSPPSKEK